MTPFDFAVVAAVALVAFGSGTRRRWRRKSSSLAAAWFIIGIVMSWATWADPQSPTLSAAAWAAVAASAAVGVVAFLRRPRSMGRGESRAAAWQGAKFENKVTSAIQRLGYPVVNDVYLPIGCGGRYTQIDHVASVGALVVAVESKNWAGSVRGRAADGHWRISGRRDWTAQNPLRQNEIHVAAVVQALGGEATGLVVVSDAASFVTGVPAGVARFADLERALKALERSHPGSRATGARWEKFARLCASVDRRVGERGHAALLSGRK